MEKNTVKHFDLIIVGGGLVGALFAISISHLPLKIAIIEAKPPQANDPRLLALNYHSCQFLKNVGIWSQLKIFASPIKHIHVSRCDHFGSVRLNANDVELSELGNVIPAAKIEFALQGKLKAISNITIYQPATLTTLEQDESIAKITLQKNDEIIELQSPIIIGADGTHSSVRTLADIATETFNYEQTAIVTETTLHRDHANIAYERFTADGAIAMLPLAATETIPHRVATIWSAKDDTITKLMQSNDQEFLQHLQNTFGYRLGKLIHISKRHTYSLKMLRADTNHKQCVFLLGNAAHTLHPIAAQGFNLSLYEVAVLVDGINKHAQTNQPLTVASLVEIASSMQHQQSLSIGLSHRISKYFRSESRVVSFALQLGMLGLERINFAKRKFVNSMLGRTGSLPRLLLSTEDYDYIER